jgi:tripartite-type tricarboxylate transporter receptor subunit TctC
MTMSRPSLLALLLLPSFFLPPLSPLSSAQAQPYPSRPVRIVVPLPPGGATDAITRAVTPRLAEIWGQQIIIENKGGANTQIGTEVVAKAAPDGYTLLATAEATVAVNPFLYRNLSYEAKDLVPISGLGIVTQTLTVHPSVPANTVAELIALAKAKPGALNYGTLGIGSSSHLNMLSFEAMAGIKLTPIHYRGGAPALTDVIGGHTQALFISVALMNQPWKAGQLKALGVGGDRRVALLPELPTIAESGLPGYQAVSWFGLFAPHGTPREIVHKINADVQRILTDASFQERFLIPNFYQAILGSPEQFADYVKAEQAKWGAIIRDAKLSAD